MAGKTKRRRRRSTPATPRPTSGRSTPPAPRTPWLLAAVVACFRPRADLVLENLALRQQLAVLGRSVKRPRIARRDRLFWLLMRRVFPRWRDTLAIVRPDTVLDWHRAGWRTYWRWKSRTARLGRPEIGWPLARLIRRLSLENPLWGRQRIAAELHLLGHEVGVSTVARYMARFRRPGRGQGWMTFLKNHMGVTAACDFFTVPTATFRSLYVFVVLSHDRRLIRHVAVTAHPTAQWTAEQVARAFPEQRPELLLRDNDAIFGDDFSEAVHDLAIEELRTSFRSPWMNPYVERVIGTLRRECTDHVITWNAEHLTRVLREYVDRYYNPARSHMSLDGNSPIPRTRDATRSGDVVATPVLGGLHHTYRRAA